MDNNQYVTNLLGAFATTLGSKIEQGIERLDGHSLTHESALVTMMYHPDESIDRLSRVLGLSHSGAVRLINTLEKEGLVERNRSLEDARIAVLRITAAGQSRAEEVLKAREHVVSEVLSVLSLEQRQMLEPVLETVLAHLAKGEDSARQICRLCDESVCRPQICPVEVAVTR